MVPDQPAQKENLLTSINPSSMEGYSSSYSSLGDIITDLPIVHNLPALIASLLPHGYKLANLGSGSGKDSQLIKNACLQLGKEGTIVNVDPFINLEGFVRKTSEDFLAQASDGEYDFLLLKYSLHFNKDHPTFFQNAYRVLKDSGTILIHQLARDAKLPWTKTIDDYNKLTAVFADDVIPPELFRWEVLSDKKVIEMDRGLFKKAIESKTWANLLLCSEQEIKQCLNLLDNMQHSMQTVLSKEQYIITKRPHA